MGPVASTPILHGKPASATTCTADTASVESLINQAYSGSPSLTTALRRWHGIEQSMSSPDGLAQGQHDALQLVDGILASNHTAPLPIPADGLTSLLNQVLCFVVLDPAVADADNAWVVHVTDPTTTFVTEDKGTGIQLQANGVTVNTLVTAIPVNTGTLHTPLDNYATVYEWTLTPAQALAPGTTATIGMCPDTIALSKLPPDQLDAVLGRLVLGHQQSETSFQLLARVDLPPEMALQCPVPGAASLHSTLGQRLLGGLANLLMPERAHAALRRRAFTGGVGGSTSEFSPFGPVDPQLYAIGGVGGSTSEFVRTHGSLLAIPTPTVVGTVGTTRTGNSGLPSITIKTFLGTPIPGVEVSFSPGAPATQTPAGNASICGASYITDADGVAHVTCLNFGNTVQYRVAYTKLSSVFNLPSSLLGNDEDGNPIVTIDPAGQNWLIASYGPSTLTFTQPIAGRTVAAGNPFLSTDHIPARVEIRSDLGDIVPIATNGVTLSLNKNTFAGSTSTSSSPPIPGAGAGATIGANAVAGIATFSPQVPTPATGYRFTASAMLSNTGLVSNSAPANLFDVILAPPSGSMGGAGKSLDFLKRP